jgi:hypothetical protein
VPNIPFIIGKVLLGRCTTPFFASVLTVKVVTFPDETESGLSSMFASGFIRAGPIQRMYAIMGRSNRNAITKAVFLFLGLKDNT